MSRQQQRTRSWQPLRPSQSDPGQEDGEKGTVAGAPSAKRPFPLCVWAIVSLAARGQPTLQALTLAPSGAQERPPRRPPPPTLLHGSEHSTITELAMGPRAQLTNRWRPGGQNPACSNLCSQTLHFLLTNRSSDLPVPGRAEVTSRAVRTGVCPCPWTAAAGGEGLMAQPARAGHTACPLTRCHARTERLLGTGHGSLESVLPLRSLRLGPGSEAAGLPTCLPHVCQEGEAMSEREGGGREGGAAGAEDAGRLEVPVEVGI